MKKSRKNDRKLACELAAVVLAGHPDRDFVPHAWSLAVFFQRYIELGPEATAKDFGPREPVKLEFSK